MTSNVNEGHFLNFVKCLVFFLPILMNILENAIIMKTQILYYMKYDPRGDWDHIWSTFYVKIHFYLDTFFIWNLISSTNIKLNAIIWPQRSMKVTFSNFFEKSFMIFYPFRWKIKCMLLTLWSLKFIMQIFPNIKFDLIITLTHVLIDNFCPCCM